MVAKNCIFFFSKMIQVKSEFQFSFPFVSWFKNSHKLKPLKIMVHTKISLAYKSLFVKIRISVKMFLKNFDSTKDWLYRFFAGPRKWQSINAMDKKKHPAPEFEHVIFGFLYSKGTRNGNALVRSATLPYILCCSSSNYT